MIRDEIKLKKTKQKLETDISSQTSKLFEKSLDNMKKSFLMNMKKLINTRKRKKILLDLLVEKNIIVKNFNKIRKFVIISKLWKSNKNLSNKLNELKIIIDEKSEIIKNSQLDKFELNSRLEKFATINNSLSEENVALKEKIEETETKIEKDNLRFKELFKQNVNDIKRIS